MPTIGKISSFVIFICLFPSAIFAEEMYSGFGISVTPAFGMLYGKAKEIVYKDPPRGDMLESELQWDIMPLFYAGLAVDFGLVDNFNKHGFIGSLSFKMGIPQRTGIMEDKDWRDVYLVPSGTLTDYSCHDNFSEKAILADLSLGGSFHISNFIALGLSIDFSYMHYYWNAKNGYGRYMISADEIKKVDFEGTVLEYTQDWFIFSPGVFIKLRLGSYFSLNGNFSYSPLIYCTDKDYHLDRGITFLDYLYYGHYLKGCGGITILPMDNLDLTLFLSYSSIIDSRGDTYINSQKYPYPIAGGGYASFDVGLSIRLHLFGWR